MADTARTPGGANLRRSRGLLLAAAVASAAAPSIPGAALAAYPLRIMVTLIHEGGHALVTVFTGGQVVGMQVQAGGSGLTQSLGGIPAAIYMAGYVGATLFGAACLVAARRPGAGRRTLRWIAVIMAACALLWSRDLFTVGMSLGVAALLIAAAAALPPAAADFAGIFLGVQFCLNALMDIRTLLLLTTATSVDNDAVFMARAFGLTPWFWALAWGAASVAILIAGLRVAWSGRTRA